MKSKSRFLPSLRAAAFLLTCGSLSAQTYTFQRNDFGQVVTNADGSQYTFPDNNYWTQTYTTAEDNGGNTYVSAYTNWNPDTSYPNGSGVNAIVGPQTDPNGDASLDGVHVQENASIQNLQLTSGASLLIDSANSGGAGSSNVTLTLANSAAGTLQNDGAIEVNSIGTSAVTLTVSNALSVSGSGTLGLAAGATLSGPGTITQASPHTIQGGGSSTISTPLVNHGLITANDYGDTNSGSVANTEINFSGASITNDGTMSTVGSGSLVFTGNVIANTGGLITLGNTANPNNGGSFFGGELEGASITGGTLTSTGSYASGLGYFLVDTSASTLSGVTLTTGTLVQVDTTLNLNGAIANSGQIFPIAATVNIAADTNLSGSGEIFLAQNSQVTIPSGVTLTQDATSNIDGEGSISGAGTLSNAGVVVSDVGDTLTFEPANCTNTGTLKAVNGSVLDLTGGTTINNAGGTISVADATSEVDFEASVSITGGTLSSASTYTGSAGGNFSVLGAMTLTNVTLTANSDITVHNALTLAGTITNNGDIVDVAAFNTNSSINLAADATVDGTGEIILFQSTDIDATNNAVLTNGSGHTIVGAPGTINASLTNDGVLIAADSDALTQSTSSTLTNYNATTQTLTGGTYESYSTGDQTQLYLNIGSVVTNAASVIYHGTEASIYETNTSTDPFITMTANEGSFSLLVQRQFSSAGALANSGTITLDAGSTFHVGGAYTASGATSNLAVIIGGTASTGATSPGVLQVNGAATVAGDLTLSFASGATLPQSTDTLTILSAASAITGNFANVAAGTRLNTTDGMGSFRVDYGAESAASPSAVVLSHFSTGLVPVITSILTASGTTDTAFSYQITASGGATSFGASGKPSGLSVNKNTGLISGTLANSSKGNKMLTLKATNAAGVGSATLMLTVTQGAPVITSSATATAVVGQAFSYQIEATQEPASYNVTGKPPGLTINKTTGLLSGTPTAAGTKTLTLSATNATGTTTKTLTLTIFEVPVITSAKNATATVGQAFSYQITASHDPANYGATGLPSGLRVDHVTGVISGTPATTATGTKTITLMATNAAGAGTGTLTLTIAK